MLKVPTIDLNMFSRIEWDDTVWEDTREQLQTLTLLPPKGSEERNWLDARLTRNMLLEMVSILDGMERLVSLAEREILDESPILQNWLTSIRGLQRRMLRSLERVKVRTVPALGKPFDPKMHEAVEVRDYPSLPPATIVEIREKAYLWGDRVLREGKVVVTPKSPRKENGL